MQTVLLDTNVLIAFEDTGRELSDRDAGILRKAQGSFAFYVHPRQVEDIEQDGDERRKAILKSRIKQYEMLESPPNVDEEYFESQGWMTGRRNDEVDNCLLSCIAKPIVNYLVTEDRGILKKAVRSNIANRVLTLDELAAFLEVDIEEPELACVVHQPCHCIDVSDPFFDSLREDYGGSEFDNWFVEKCSTRQRKHWAVYSQGKLGALCIYKLEENEAIDDRGFKPKGRFLKLCTFKVADGLRGSKVGERLLHTAFLYGRAHGCTFVYFTVREEKQRFLMALAADFGFERLGKSGEDRVLGKYLLPQTQADEMLSKEEFVARFYPSYKSGPDVRKFIVPIRPQYHERLFPDVSDFKLSLLGDLPEMYTSESNTIRKAYICRSNTERVEPGDLLLFYRTVDRHEVDALGVVIKAIRSKSVEQIMGLVHRRTVYTENEIKAMLADDPRGKGLLVICFDIIDYFKKAVGRDRLAQLSVNPPISISSVGDAAFAAIMEAGK